MTSKDNYCVIMGGGIGSRFWPFSRKTMPKQFLDFFGTGRSLLQQTFDRFNKIIPTENILIVTNAIYADLIKEQLPELFSVILLRMKSNIEFKGIDEKQLDQERRVAAELDVKADDAAQHRHHIILDQCADQPEDNSQRDTCQPQTQGQPRRFFKQRQVLCDHIPIHKGLPFPIGSRTKLGTKKSGPSLRRFPDKGQVQHMGGLVGPTDHAR